MLTVFEADRWVNTLSRIAINVFGNGEDDLVRKYIEQLPNLINAVNHYSRQVKHPADIETIFVKHARNTRLRAFWDDILNLQVGSLIVNENPTQLKNLVRAQMVGKLTAEPTQHGTTYLRITEFLGEDFPEHPEYNQYGSLLHALAPIYREVELEQWQREHQQQLQEVHNGELSRATTPLMGID